MPKAGEPTSPTFYVLAAIFSHHVGARERTVSEPDESGRSCGTCSLCCTVLRVDELNKLGGVDCQHQCKPQPTPRQDPGASDEPAQFGCAIHSRRPQICRDYRCLWLAGGLREDDRPDKLGAVVDILTLGAETRLSIQEAHPGAYDASARLQDIAAQHRENMPVRIVAAGNYLDPDRPFRVMLARGEEHRVTGEWTTVLLPGEAPLRRRLPWMVRLARRAAIWIRGLKIAGSRGGPPEDR